MNARTVAAALFLLGVVCVGVGCGGSTPAPPSGGSTPAPPSGSNATPQADAASDEPLPPSRLDTELDPGIRAYVGEPFTGDLDQMVKRRLVRIGVTFNRTFFFLDQGVQRGIAYEYGRLVE